MADMSETGFGRRSVCTGGCMSARGVGLVLGRAEEVEEKLKKSRREWLRGKKRWETDEEGEEIGRAHV